MAEKKFDLSLIIKAVDNATAPLRRIGERLKTLTTPARDVGKAFGKVGSETLGLATKFAAFSAAAGFGLFHVVKGAVDAGDKLGEMAQRVGLGVDAYAQLQFAAAQSDIEAEKFNSSMDGFNQRMGQVKAGTGKFLAFLNKVSPTLAKQVRGAKDNDQALDLLAKAFVKVEDPAKRAALAMAAGLDPQFGQFLGQGPEAIKALKDQFAATAGPQEQFAARSGVLDNSLRLLAVSFEGIKNKIVTALMPAFNRLAIMLTDFFTKHGDKLVAWAERANGEFQAWVNSGGIDRLIASLREVAATIGKVVDALGGPKGLAIAFAAIQVAPLVGALANLGMALGSLGATVIPLALKALLALKVSLAHVNFILVGMAALPFVAAFAALAAAGYQVYKNWEPLKEFFGEVWELIKNIASFNIGGVIKQVGQFFGVESSFGNAFKPETRPTLGAASATGPLSAITQTNNAAVSVSFSGLPPGARVTPAQGNTAPLDLSLGYSMLGVSQ